ncbi:MAG: DUF4249 domain-containing protein [Bacteroidetes bacterium]|nr:DUF4249 domain-containing protein [Bacteroidota bacterium]
MKLIKISILLTAIFIFGCEKIDVIEINLPYDEKIVVQGLLEGYQNFQGVSFTRTLPLDETFTIEKAELKDVVCFLKDGVRVIPLKYSSKGIYKPLVDFKVEPNREYELFGKWQDKNVYAKTFVPNNPAVQNVFLIDNGTTAYVKGDVLNKPGQFFGATWAVYDNNIFIKEAEEMFALSKVSENENEKLPIRTITIPRDVIHTFKGKIYMRVYSFDEKFGDYFKTKKFNQPIEDTFTQAGGNIEWNVYGDGIGMFLGIGNTLVPAR